MYRSTLYLFITFLSINLVGQTCEKSIPEIYVSNKARDIYQSKLEQAKTNYKKNPNADNLIWLGRREAYLGNYETAIDIYSKGTIKLTRFVC